MVVDCRKLADKTSLQRLSIPYVGQQWVGLGQFNIVYPVPIPGQQHSIGNKVVGLFDNQAGTSKDKYVLVPRLPMFRPRLR